MLDSAGQWNVVYFVIVVFAGAFYMVNLTFPVVALAYYTEVSIAAQVKFRFLKYQRSKIGEEILKFRKRTKLRKRWFSMPKH